jgi:hypothetical protein
MVSWEGRRTKVLHPFIFHHKCNVECGDAPGSTLWIQRKDLNLGEYLLLLETRECGGSVQLPPGVCPRMKAGIGLQKDQVQGVRLQVSHARTLE